MKIKFFVLEKIVGGRIFTSYYTNIGKGDFKICGNFFLEKHHPHHDVRLNINISHKPWANIYTIKKVISDAI